MEPHFGFLLFSVAVFTLLVILYIHWRFGTANMISFIILTGIFSAIMDFLSAFTEVNYEYPGKSKLWVFSFIFLGWTSIAASCIFLAEGILVKHKKNLVTQKNLLWQVPLLTAFLAVLLDLFIDPVAVATGYWIWFVPGKTYFGIPMLNFIGWFVLMLVASAGWIFIIRQEKWKGCIRILVSFLLLFPMILISALLSILLRNTFTWLGIT